MHTNVKTINNVCYLNFNKRTYKCTSQQQNQMFSYLQTFAVVTHTNYKLSPATRIAMFPSTSKHVLDKN